ncbi:MAG: hypothetical protein M1832_005502 [Thelocarpon impressellum]|nr:MAG: hypothetical protein M1832_005502 [Thelocarpon impressellum]
MLGALFSNAASTLKPSGHTSVTSAKPIISLDSVQEDIHTRGLLFPDASQLHRSQDHAYPLSTKASPHGSSAASGFDCQGELDLESSRDIRIIIAQEATASQPKTVLFDSRATAAPQDAPPQAEASHGACPTSSTATASQVGQPSNLGSQPSHPATLGQASDPFRRLPIDDTAGVFDRSRRRGINPGGTADARQKLSANDPPGGMRLLLDCVFGSAPLSYRGDSTKLHVFPADRKAETRSATTSPVITEQFGSLGRGDGRRRSQLARSVTPSGLSDLGASTSSSALGVKGADIRTVLITRTFSVDLPDAPEAVGEGSDRSPAPLPALDTISSFPFPPVDDRARPGGPKRPRQRKTPMYAIALILQISVSPPSTPAIRSTTQSVAGVGGHNAPDGDGSCSSSFDTESISGWTFLNPKAGGDLSSLAPMSGSDVDDRVDIIIERWDVISRMMSTLQSTVKLSIAELLRHAAAVTSPPLVPPTSPSAGQIEAGEDPGGLKPFHRNKLPKINYQVVQLVPGALSTSQALKQSVDREASRLALGLRIPRVLTGQGRWGVWREEARWVGRWGGGKEQNFFFFNLLTAFLGNHTEWLSALGPTWYRQRRSQHHRANGADDLSIPHRTVVVSKDKMVARRLIFLLSAFLPAASIAFDQGVYVHGNTAASSRAFSQSLPSNQLPREQSLRRTINKRGGITRSKAARKANADLMSLSTAGEVTPPTSLDGQSGGRTRRSFEAGSVNSAASLSIPQGNGKTRKSSTATTATTTPTTTVPHFSSHHADRVSGTSAEPRPGSSGSLASLNLMHTLKRNNSTDHSTDSQPVSRWGSLISGFWSNRRDSSTDDSEINLPPEEGLRIVGVRRARHSGSSQTNGKLARMVKQVHASRADGELYQEDLEEEEATRPSTERGRTEIPNSPPKDIGTFSGQAIPARPKPAETSFKLSVDENDGVIDVDVPMAGFFSPGACSPSTSPSTAGVMSLASLEASSAYGLLSPCPFSSVDPEFPVNVGGWLKRYHQDFALQAVQPYQGLEDEIKRSMRAEPTPCMPASTPNVEGPPSDGWVDVCTTLIADAQSFSVKRLRLRRRAKIATTPDTSGVQHSPSGVTTPGSPVEDRFTSEPIFDMDGTLIDAVERIIAHSQPTSKAHSTASSYRNEQRPSDATDRYGEPIVEVPRKDCQKLVLGALEQVVRSVAIQRGRYEDGEGPGAGPEGGTHATESTLREGVRKWLGDVEDMN